MPPTEDKAAWCEHGAAMERRFIEEVAPLAGIDVKLNPQKTEGDIYAHDLIVAGRRADLKAVTTPFFKAWNQYGLRPEKAITFNHKDYLRYMAKYPDLWVIFWVDWPADERYGISVAARQGVWVANIQTIDHLITRRRTGFHPYLNRAEDTTGNAKASHVISIDDLFCRWEGNSKHE